jgi:hypothetical protein
MYRSKRRQRERGSRVSIGVEGKKEGEGEEGEKIIERWDESGGWFGG